MEFCPWRFLDEERIKSFLTDEKNNEGAPDRKIAIDYLRENFDKIRLLDVGCGTGHHFLAMKQQLKEFEYHGIDKTQKMVDFARRRFPLNLQENVRSNFTVGDIHELPFPDRFWDVVYCLQGDTPVFGSNVEIANIKKDDLVAGSAGQEQRVLEVFKRHYQGELFKVRVLGLPEITMTPEHPVLVTKFKRRHVRCKKQHGEDVYVYDRGKIKWKLAKDLQRGEFVLVPRRRARKNSHFYLRVGWKTHMENRQKVKIKIDEEIAEIFGLYVAEGSFSRPYHTVFTLGRHEKKLVKRLVNLIEKKMGLRTSTQQSPSLPTTTKVDISCKDLIDFLEREFGEGAHNKHVSRLIKDAPTNVVKGFINGLLEGDGNLNGTTLEVKTVSKKLALDLLELLYNLGITPSFYPFKRPKKIIEGRVTPEGIDYRVRFAERVWNTRGKDLQGRNPYLRTRVDDGFVYLPIRSIESFNGELSVYNLHTEDETFCVPFLVHNCRHVLTHLPSYKRALPELARVCSDCLILCLLFPLAGKNRIGIMGKPPEQTKPGNFSEHYLNIYAREPFLEALKSFGFNLVVDEKVDVGDYFKYFELLVFRRG